MRGNNDDGKEIAAPGPEQMTEAERDAGERGFRRASRLLARAD